MKAKYSNSRRNRNSSLSNVSSTSSQRVKLRTIMKGRGSQQGQFLDLPNDKYQNNNNSRTSLIHSQASNYNSGRMSISLNLNSASQANRNNNQCKSVSRNSMIDKQTLNCEEQLLGRQDFDYFYKRMMNRLEVLDQQAQLLIKKKIQKIAKKAPLITLKDKGKDSISIQIENLVEKIRNLRLQQLQKLHLNKQNKQQVRQLIDRKINILQKLMAETSAQSQVLKNYFFVISALNSQSKGSSTKRSKVTQKLVPLQKRNQRSKTESKEQFCRESLNQLTYNAPKKHDYETYRYKNKDYRANLQPLPRSSYKSQYLFYHPKYVSPALKNLDNHTSFGNTRLKSSTYSKDYHLIKAQLVNYKQLDGYRNKYKNIEMNFHQGNRKDLSLKQFEKNKSYIVEQIRLKQIKQSVQSTPNISSMQKNLRISTQAKSQFKGQRPQIMSNIKNKRLDKFKYNYKTLINQ